MKADPAASMRCWAFDIEISGSVFEIPALPAADWWGVLFEPAEILQHIRTPQGAIVDFDEMLLAGQLNSADLAAALTDAVEEVTGRTFHAALVLAHAAAAHWPTVSGRLIERGFRWDVMPIAAALDAIYVMIVSSLPEKGEDGKGTPRADFERLLESEPATNGKPSARRQRAALDDFAAVAGPPPTGSARSSAAPSASARPRSRPRLERRPRGDR